VHVLERLLREERTKNLTSLTETVNSDKFNLVMQSIKERSTGFKQKIQEFDNIPVVKYTNFREDIQQ